MSLHASGTLAGAPPRECTTADRPVVASVLVEVATVVGLVGLALTARLPYLWTIPRFTDETREALLAFQILRGEDAGLVNVDAYIGGLYNWLLAILFWLIGPSPYTPRLVVALSGALTVGVTYFLARDMGGRVAGLVGAAMLATAGGHILSTGHIAWSHCLTPLFTTLGIWLLQRAVRQSRPAALLGSGLAFGLALQTHPATLVLLPGATAYLLWKGTPLLKTRWPYLALGLFLLAYANVLIYNATTGGESIATAGEIRDHYARGRPIMIDAGTYLANQGLQATMLLRYLAGAVDAREGGAAAYLLDPALWVYAALSVLGLVHCAGRGASLPLLVFLSSIAIMPYFNERKYVPISDGRYLMPLLPLAFASTGAFLARAAERVPSSVGWRVGWTVAVAALVLYPLLSLNRYYGQEIAAERTNEPLLQTLAVVRDARLPDEAVLLHSDLRDVKLEGGGTAFRSMRFLLMSSGVEERSVDNPLDYARQMAPGSSALIVIDATAFGRLARDQGRLDASGVKSSAVARTDTQDGYTVLRFERQAGGQPAAQDRADADPPRRAGAAAAHSRVAGGLLFRPDGSLLVAEAGVGGPDLVDVGREKPHAIGHTGRITRFMPNGDRSIVARGLPSIVTAVGEEVGPSAFGMIDDRLYVLIATGGWDVGYPTFNSGVFEVLANGKLERIADISAYTRDNPTRARQEDPRADVPWGMPYGMTAMDGRLYVTDGNQEQILAIVPGGQISRIVEYPKSNRALTGIAAGADGALYVAEFASQKVTRITTTGQISDAATKVRVPVGVAFDSEGALHVLEYGGRVLRAAPVGEEQRDVLAEGLRVPTAMAFGPDGNLYVSVHGHEANNGEGQIVRLRLQAAPPTSTARWIVTAVPWIAGLAVLLLAFGIGYRNRQRGPGDGAA
jgi:4-amino-4-deoxy-L-arabinose transferase-like glycosyltransferase